MFNIKLDSYSFTGMAVIVGYLLTNEFDVLEQAALGAWFNVVGDILASNSSFSDNFDLEEQKDNTEIDLETIDKAIDKLKESIEKIKKEKKFNNDD